MSRKNQHDMGIGGALLLLQGLIQYQAWGAKLKSSEVDYCPQKKESKLLSESKHFKLFHGCHFFFQGFEFFLKTPFLD